MFTLVLVLRVSVLCLRAIHDKCIIVKQWWSQNIERKKIFLENCVFWKFQSKILRTKFLKISQKYNFFSSLFIENKQSSKMYLIAHAYFFKINPVISLCVNGTKNLIWLQFWIAFIIINKTSTPLPSHRNSPPAMQRDKASNIYNT